MVKGAVGLKEEPLYEVDSIQRAINQVRGIHPPPIMNIDGQQFPLVVEGSPRSPRLMMEDCGEHMRLLSRSQRCCRAKRLGPARPEYRFPWPHYPPGMDRPRRRA